MKTPEEIKKGLEICFAFPTPTDGCNRCPYISKRRPAGNCGASLRDDALAYIQQLEADNSRKDDTIGNLTELLNAAYDETERVMQELEEYRLYEGETELEQ